VTPALAVVLVLYALSYPWAQSICFDVEMNAAKKGEHLPAWIGDAGTTFYVPLGWVIAIMPECILEPYRSYNLWSLEKAGVNIDLFIR
jgi:hypothetical protein